MAAVNPAKIIGISDNKGKIEKGYDADLNLLGKNLDIDIDMAMVMGRVVKKR